MVRLKPARGDGHWESPGASSWEFLGAQVPRLPTTKRAECPLSCLKERRHPACFPRPSRQAACAPVASPKREYSTMPTSRISKRNLPKISRGATRYRCSRPVASDEMHTVGPGPSPSQRLAGKTFVPIESSEEPEVGPPGGRSTLCATSGHAAGFKDTSCRLSAASPPEYIAKHKASQRDDSPPCGRPQAP